MQLSDEKIEKLVDVLAKLPAPQNTLADMRQATGLHAIEDITAFFAEYGLNFLVYGDYCHFQSPVMTIESEG